MKDALIEGARRWNYMMVGNEKEGSGVVTVVPATLFFVGGGWWVRPCQEIAGLFGCD